MAGSAVQVFVPLEAVPTSILSCRSDAVNSPGTIYRQVLIMGLVLVACAPITAKALPDTDIVFQSTDADEKPSDLRILKVVIVGA
jgi:hypothetical protein